MSNEVTIGRILNHDEALYAAIKACAEDGFDWKVFAEDGTPLYDIEADTKAGDSRHFPVIVHFREPV